MKQPHFLGILLLGVICTSTSIAQVGLRSGPRMGYVAHREACVLAEFDGASNNLVLEAKPVNGTGAVVTETITAEKRWGYVPVKATLCGLSMNTKYAYRFLDKGKPVAGASGTFSTPELWEWRKPAPDFSFLFGSCLYINDSLYDRPGKPYGADPGILKTMAETPSDFLLWGGDNLYLREADFSSASGMAYRYSSHFAQPLVNTLLKTRPSFAIWDDHDYGSNDSDRGFGRKTEALSLFTRYWGNPQFGEPDQPGTYGKMSWSDCDFFLLDGRYERDADDFPDSINGKPNPDKHFLGEKQLRWLINGLASSHATFKFIVNGSQVLNALNDKECFRHYPHEYLLLLEALNNLKANGVIFLTGDRHYTELIKLPRTGTYPLYDFTCSSITSGVYKGVTTGKEANNPDRMPGSLLVENNFSKISIKGPKGKRELVLEVLDAAGNIRFTHSILQESLK